MSGALAEFINEEYKIAIEKAVRNAEEKTAEKTAEKMILKNKPIDEIVEFTGLTEKKIQEIAKRLQKQHKNKHKTENNTNTKVYAS